MSTDKELSAFLGAIEDLLRNNVLPSATGDARFAGLMAASALGMAKREITLGNQLAATARDLAEFAPQPSPFDDPAEAIVHLIRAGMLDGQDDLHRRLLIQAITRAAVTRPQALSDSDRSLADLA